MKRKYIDPTVKDIKQIIRTKYHIETVREWYNDKRLREGSRRIKLPINLTSQQMAELKEELIQRFPAHEFAIGEHIWYSRWYTNGRRTVTVIHIFRNNELYDKLFPAPGRSAQLPSVVLTFDDIAKLAGCAPEQIRLKLN